MPKAKEVAAPKQRELAKNSDDFQVIKEHMMSLIPGLDPSPAVVTKYAFNLAVDSLKKPSK